MQENEKPTIGLALGGGAARGAAHLGILKALEEQSLKPDFISGTSIGAFVAALYAFGKTPEEMRDIASSLHWLEMSGFAIPKYGLFSNDEMGKLIEKHVGDVNIEDSPIPLSFIATDISTGKAVTLKKGKLSTAVMASACVPGIFIPVSINGQKLVDGGLVENVPISPLQEEKADIIVAVDLNGVRRYDSPDGIIDVLLNAFDIAIDNTTEMQTKDADVLIQMDLAGYSRTSSVNVWELYAEGYRDGVIAIKRIYEEIEDRAPSSFEILGQKFKQWRDSTNDDSVKS
jgi:NTE family protein